MKDEAMSHTSTDSAEGRRSGPVQTMGSSAPDRVSVRGYDLCEDLIGQIDFADMIVLELIGRLPSSNEKTLVNAVLVTITEHGMTPSSIATRLTYTGAPESLQGAVAAGLLGAGNVFLGAMENAATLLQGLVGENPMDVDDATSRHARIHDYVASTRESGKQIAGLGHPVHRPEDPRTASLFDLADRLGFPRTYRDCLLALHAEAERVSNRTIPINAAGAIGAVILDAGMPPRMCRGLAIIARSAGLVGHIMDESQTPTGRTIWEVVDEAIAYEPGRRDPIGQER